MLAPVLPPIDIVGAPTSRASPAMRARTGSSSVPPWF